MMARDLLDETIYAVKANKARSGLTILGIVIGIGSVIAMVSIGQGAQSSIESNIQSIGSNLLEITPGFQRGAGMNVSAGRGSAQTLTIEDADAVSQLPLVKAVAPSNSNRYQVAAKSNNTNTLVISTVPAYAQIRNIQMEQGSFITDQQVSASSRIVVLGPTVNDDLFGEGVSAIGKIIKINKVDFTVTGIAQLKGGSGFNNPDDTIYLPISTAKNYLASGSHLSSISVQAEDQSSLTIVQNQINEILLVRHNISDLSQSDFQILNQADLVETATSVAATFTILLGAIAGISLLVGGIGIMNMMLTNVTERTKEIGLRKSIGARRSEISSQFLAESVLLTLIGGILGIILGWLASKTVTKFTGITTLVSTFSIFLAFGVSAGIGILFGYYPARRAAKMDPISSLRYE